MTPSIPDVVRSDVNGTEFGAVSVREGTLWRTTPSTAGAGNEEDPDQLALDARHLSSVTVGSPGASDEPFR